MMLAGRTNDRNRTGGGMPQTDVCRVCPAGGTYTARDGRYGATASRDSMYAEIDATVGLRNIWSIGTSTPSSVRKAS